VFCAKTLETLGGGVTPVVERRRVREDERLVRVGMIGGGKSG
jgi:hypothetical protein